MYKDVSNEKRYVLFCKIFFEIDASGKNKIVSCLLNFASTILFVFENHNFIIVIRRLNAKLSAESNNLLNVHLNCTE
jgi:hypothetical protein